MPASRTLYQPILHWKFGKQPKVGSFVEQVKRNGYQLRGDILIENVSGPAIQKSKSDFLIKIMVPIK
jgi:effector-binding domain-containing protein